MDILKQEIVCTAQFNVDGQRYIGVYGTLAELKSAIEQHVDDMNEQDEADNVCFPELEWEYFVDDCMMNRLPAYMRPCEFEDESTVFAQTVTAELVAKLFEPKNKALQAAHDALVVLGDWLENEHLDKEYISHPLLSTSDVVTHKPLGNIVMQTLGLIRLALKGKK